METGFRISPSFLEEQNKRFESEANREYDALGEALETRGISIELLVRRAGAFEVALPSWAVGTGGTRFARFPAGGEPRTVGEKLVDCATVHQLMRITPRVSPHIPWDKPAEPQALKAFAESLGLGFDAINSNTFQDQPGQNLSYKFGSLTHTDKAVRRQAIEHNLECIEIGKKLGSKALTVWIGDGSNLPGQISFRQSLDRYLESLRVIVNHLPNDWRLFLEYKPYEPALYATVLNDWGTAYYCATDLGSKVFCLVDLGHHLPNTNIEMVVSRLLQFGKLGGFHFNDSKYGDDDLDAGSIKPFQLFLVFHELVSAGEERRGNQNLSYMIDQSHNVTDPLESLMLSAEEIQRAYVQALLVDQKALAAAQEENDAIMALRILKEAFRTDVTPILRRARQNAGGALDPILTYRASGYRAHKAKERPARSGTSAGIV
ncbi:MAG: putative sugar isomerase R00627 [Bacteroidia bacterium]|nr:MAG: putative sugar isomerase R00627 [Bacteroidia bacterium]